MTDRAMTGADFAAWIAHMRETRGWSQAECLRRLGAGMNQAARWREHGTPLYIALACGAINFGVPPWRKFRDAALADADAEQR